MARTRSPAIVAWLAIGMVALIAYGSLYPFNLKTPEHTLGWWQMLWQALTQLSWARAGHGDRVANVLLYVPLGFCLSLWLDGRLRHRGAVVVATLSGAALSLLIEVAQVFISSRVPSLWDVTLNTGGALCGAIGGIAWFSLSARLPSTEGGGGDKTALLVLALWFASCWAPFSPHFTLSKLKAALQPLFEPQVTLIATIDYLVWWTLVAQIIFALTSAQRGVEMLLAAIAAVLVGRLFIADLSFVPAELIALALLLPTLVLLHRLWAPTRRVLLLAAFIFVFLFARLTPFSASGSGHFDLWPFIAWSRAGMPVSLHELFKQLFEFAALAWLLREAGLSARLLVWSVPLAVLALEVVALWIPGRDGSPAAPLLALATTLTLRYASARRGFTHQRVRSR
jgi:VanZ family protein